VSHRVYVIENATGRTYIGLSEHPDVRLDQHNRGLSRWTRGKGPWLLKWLSRPMTLTEARRLESLLKRQKGGQGMQRLLAEYGS
jgi:putative endonuclease